MNKCKLLLHESLCVLHSVCMYVILFCEIMFDIYLFVPETQDPAI